LIVAKVEAIGEGWMFDVALQSCPAGEAVLPGDGKLRVAVAKGCAEDFGVWGVSETGMELANLLRCVGETRGVFSEQIAGLIPEMVQVGVGWEASYRHNELPFVCPGVRIEWAESEFVKTSCRTPRWTSVLPADRMRPERGVRIARREVRTGKPPDMVFP
jgi:hypothetical protein